MALKFYNIRSRETRVAETEPMIAALWASSDRSPNASQGQDFGWRLAPEVVVELKRIRSNPRSMQDIAVKYNLPMEAITETDILQYISDRTSASEAPVAQEGDYEDEYRQQIRTLEQENQTTTTEAPSTTTTTTVAPTTTTTTTTTTKSR